MTANSVRTPWHHWVVAIVSLLWNSFGAFDYSMSQLRGAAYYQQAGMTEAQIAFMGMMPGWAFAAWAVGVWGAVLGSLGLLLRRRFAVPAFIISLLAFVLTLINSYVLMDGGAVMGGQTQYMISGAIFIASLFFIFYARRAAAQGILR